VSRRYLTDHEYSTVLRQKEDGINQTKIARALGVSRRTIYRIINTKNLPRQPCGGRPSSFSVHDDTSITRRIKLHHYLPVAEIRRANFPQISYTSFLWKIKKLGFMYRQLRQKPILVPRPVALRRSFLEHYAFF